MFIYFIRWIKSFFYTPLPTITENPITYLQYKLTPGNNTLYIRRGSLFYNICPPAYDAKIQVSDNMSDVELDNNIVNIRSLIYDSDRPVWPKFKGRQPIERWTTPCLLYFSMNKIDS